MLGERKILLVGAGGLGSAAGPVLARAGVGQIDVLDDDRVAPSDLHRQILYDPEDVGHRKAPAARAALRREAARFGHDLHSVAREMRLTPQNARTLVADYDLVVEGADNFATKFLAADACRLAAVPLVQAGAVRWVGWALATLPSRGPCLRCVFEGVPEGDQAGCAEAGVVGPVVGVLGALEAALALRLLRGSHQAAGVLWSYRALPGVLRRRRVQPRGDCPLCSGTIKDLDINQYLPPQYAMADET